jgi:hypothetical protein
VLGVCLMTTNRTPLLIEITSRRCGTEFEPDRRAIVGSVLATLPRVPRQRRLAFRPRGLPDRPQRLEVGHAPRSLPRPEAATMRLSRLQHMIGRSVECLGDA